MVGLENISNNTYTNTDTIANLYANSKFDMHATSDELKQFKDGQVACYYDGYSVGINGDSIDGIKNLNLTYKDKVYFAEHGNYTNRILNIIG